MDPPFGFTTADSPLTATSFPAVSPPPAYSRKWPATHPTGNHPAGFDSPSVFLALLRLYSARFLPVLFHTGPAHGVFSSRADFHSQSFLFFQTIIPSCGWLPSWPLSQSSSRSESPGLDSSRRSRLSWNSASFQLLHFRVLLPVRVCFFHNDYLCRVKVRDPHGFYFLRVFLLSARDFTRNLPSHELYNMIRITRCSPEYYRQRV